jgi:hypothetical protein
MGAPPTVTPGEPKVLLLWPVVVVPPIGVDCPKVLPDPESPVVVEVVEPLLPNGDDPAPPVGEEGDELKGELLFEEDPIPEFPKEDPEEDPNPEDDPKPEEDPNPEVPVVVPDVVPVEAPVGVIPLDCIAWPNNPIGPTFASPR